MDGRLKRDHKYQDFFYSMSEGKQFIDGRISSILRFEPDYVSWNFTRFRGRWTSKRQRGIIVAIINHTVIFSFVLWRTPFQGYFNFDFSKHVVFWGGVESGWQLFRVFYLWWRDRSVGGEIVYLCEIEIVGLWIFPVFGFELNRFGVVGR